MLASLADAPLDDPAARLRTEVRRHPRDRRRSAPAGASASGRGSATRRRASFPRSPRRSSNGRARAAQPLVLDGEIVALDADGEPAGFQQLQGRIHLRTRTASPSGRSARALIAFDILRDGTDRLPRSAAHRATRRAREDLRRAPDRRCCASATRSAATAARCTSRRSSSGWEGLIAKHAASLYKSGKRIARLAQAQTRPRAGIRRRRLDRAAPDARATSARCCSASTKARISSTSGTPAPASTRRSSRA